MRFAFVILQGIRRLDVSRQVVAVPSQAKCLTKENSMLQPLYSLVRIESRRYEFLERVEFEWR